MGLEILDNFINEFSKKINILIKYEFKSKVESFQEHKFLFNLLLFNLFERKQYGLDYECWKELYLRSLYFYKYEDKIGNIPLVKVTKHNEILPFYFKNKIHKINHTFVHFDSHPDFNYIDLSNNLPLLYKNYLKSNDNNIKKAQNIVWDIGAANSGVFISTGIRDTIWCMPTWIPDNEINLNYFIKENKKVYEIKTNTDIRKMNNLEEFTYMENKEKELKIYSKIQTGKLSKKSLKNLLELIKKNGNKYILDIDLDYFVCNGKSYNQSYKNDSYDLSSPNRTEYIDYQTEYPREYPKENKKLQKFNKLLNKEIKEINQRIKHFLLIIRYLKKYNYIPSHISICDSTNVHFSNCETCNSVSNNYVPLNLALYVHTKVFNGLEKIFN